MKQAVGLHWEYGAMNPGRLPWAGMKQAVGLKGLGQRQLFISISDN
jgi:hypothetical protein